MSLLQKGEFLIHIFYSSSLSALFEIMSWIIKNLCMYFQWHFLINRYFFFVKSCQKCIKSLFNIHFSSKFIGYKICMCYSLWPIFRNEYKCLAELKGYHIYNFLSVQRLNKREMNVKWRLATWFFINNNEHQKCQFIIQPNSCLKEREFVRFPAKGRTSDDL